MTSPPSEGSCSPAPRAEGGRGGVARAPASAAVACIRTWAGLAAGVLTGAVAGAKGTCSMVADGTSAAGTTPVGGGTCGAKGAWATGGVATGAIEPSDSGESISTEARRCIQTVIPVASATVPTATAVRARKLLFFAPVSDRSFEKEPLADRDTGKIERAV